MGPLPIRMLDLLYGVLCLLTSTAFGMMLKVKFLNLDNERRSRLYQGLIFLIFLFGVPASYLGRHLVDLGYKPAAFVIMAVFVILGLVLGLVAGKNMREFM